MKDRISIYIAFVYHIHTMSEDTMSSHNFKLLDDLLRFSREQNKVLEELVDKLTNDCKSQKSQITVLEEQNNTLRIDNSDLTNQLKTQSDTISTLENTIAVLKASQSNSSTHNAPNTISTHIQIIDPRTGFHALPNDATLTMEYGARAYVTDAYPGYVWRNGYWYKVTSSLTFTRMSDASIYSRLCKSEHDGPTHFTQSNNTAHSVMINDSFDAVMIDGVRLFARRMIYVTKPTKELADRYHGFYIPATGSYQHQYSDSDHSDQIVVEHSYIADKRFSDNDTDPVLKWNLFEALPGKSYIYQGAPYACDGKKCRQISITDEQKEEILRRGMLYISEIVKLT